MFLSKRNVFSSLQNQPYANFLCDWLPLKTWRQKDFQIPLNWAFANVIITQLHCLQLCFWVKLYEIQSMLSYSQTTVKEAKTDIIRDVQKQSHIRHKGCKDNRSVHNMVTQIWFQFINIYSRNYPSHAYRSVGNLNLVENDFFSHALKWT